MKISIITLYYNAEDYLQEMLSSIASQSHKDLELIIVNDGSTSQSTSSLQSIIQKFEHIFPISVVTHEQNKGVSEARNTGLKHVRGKYVTFLDADDKLCGRFSLEFRHDFLEEHLEYDMTAGYAIKINAQGGVIPEEDRPLNYFTYFNQAQKNPQKLLQYYCEYSMSRSDTFVYALFLFAGSSLIRKEVFDEFLFDPAFEKEEDIEWTLRTLSQSKLLKLHKIPFHFRRVHEQQYHLNTPRPVTKQVLEKMKSFV